MNLHNMHGHFICTDFTVIIMRIGSASAFFLARNLIPLWNFGKKLSQLPWSFERILPKKLFKKK
jgi:hypothetical protein